MNIEILKVITNYIGERAIDILDKIYPEWEEKEKDFQGSWNDFVFNSVYEKLLEDKQ